jgi:hypothetical protein
LLLVFSRFLFSLLLIDCAELHLYKQYQQQITACDKQIEKAMLQPLLMAVLVI